MAGSGTGHRIVRPGYPCSLPTSRSLHMRLLSSGGVLAALSLVVACSPAPAPVAAGPDTAAIRTAITAQEAKIGAAFEAKDTSVMRSVFTDDAVWTMQDATASS